MYSYVAFQVYFDIFSSLFDDISIYRYIGIQVYLYMYRYIDRHLSM